MTQPVRGLTVWVWILISLLGNIATSAAQRLPEFPTEEAGPTYVTMDLLTTRGVSPDSTRVDVYYSLSNDLFTFVRTQEDNFVGHYELSLMINDDDGFQLLGETFRDSLVVETELASRVTDASKARLFSTTLQPGKYTIELNILDIESSQQLVFSRKFEVADFYKKELSISDLQFAGLITPEESLNDSRFGVNIVPNLLRSYGEDQSEMYVYYEVYTEALADTEKPMKVTYKIKSGGGKEIVKKEEVLPRQGTIGRYSRRFDTKDFSHGAYTLEVNVRDEAIRKSARMKGVFYVSWRYLLPLTNAKNFKEILEQLKYIGSKEELKTLNDLKKADGNEQQGALMAFWKNRDPTPGTEKNENMLLYYRRIDFANRNFTAGIGKGWKSDQGRIYVIYGAPDEIDRRNMEAGSQPYEVWHYTNIARSFVFVDLDGYGRYELTRIF